MSIFGIGFRIVLVALAVLVERAASFVRDNPLVRSFLASPPGGFEDDLSEEA